MTEPDYMTSMQRDDPTVDSTELVEAYERGVEDLKAAVAGMTPDQVLALILASDEYFSRG